jgi:hypothetical protein
MDLSSLQRHWTIYLVHHPHTDIGYTDTQDRIERYHVQFLDRVLELRKQMRASDSPFRGFVWNSECFWSIDRYLARADDAKKRELAEAIKDGTIGLTATWLHFNELIDQPLLNTMLRRAGEYGRSIGVNVDSAFAADINGFSWGYVEALAQAGVKNFLVNLHSHHGLSPIGKRQLPFRWKGPAGSEIVVWNGEHYMLGNALGLAPRAMLTYTFSDELYPQPHSSDNAFFAEKRVPRYLRQLELDEYPYDFVQVSVGGACTDNAPPNEHIARFANEWNARHGNRVTIKMVTVSGFFEQLAKSKVPIPTYAGDWPDWWSDGLAGNPEQTLLFRQAQRTYNALRQVPAAKGALDAKRCDEIERELASYAEHTFSHSDSMRFPWDATVKMIAGDKKAFAYRVALEVEHVLDDTQIAMGQAPMAIDQPFLYRVFNPSGTPTRDIAMLYIEGMDFNVRQMAAEIVPAGKNDPLTSQRTSALRGVYYAVQLDLPAHGSATLEMRDAIPTNHFDERAINDGQSLQGKLPDVAGAEPAPPARATPTALETPFVKLAFEVGRGITRWDDAVTGRSLLRSDLQHLPFTPVYEVTPVGSKSDSDAMCRTRGLMGRNRKGPNVQRHVGELESVEVVESGPLFATVSLSYKLAGTSFFKVLLTAFTTLPRVDVKVRMNKDSVWEPENLYLSLPFTSGEAGELWVEKPGAILRPWKDQLPDTLTDWSCIQDGFAVQSEGYGVAVATPDAPLLQLGSLEYGVRKLMGHPSLAAEPMRPYSWLMTNYWETNFEASLGGFHEFRYHLEWGKHLTAPAESIRRCRALNLGYRVFRVTRA